MEDEAPPLVAEDNTYRTILRPEARGLRDAYLREFNKEYKIGRLFGGDGAELSPGATSIQWLQRFKIFDSRSEALNGEELKRLFLLLGRAFHNASTFHSNLYLAAEKLRSAVEEEESKGIEEELKKYDRGGEYWDATANKLIKRVPGKEVLEKTAQAKIWKLRRLLRDLDMEVRFFEYILADLESQRRCLKDYSDFIQSEMRLNGIMQ